MRLKADTSWDCTIEVGRWTVATLSPLLVGEADAARTTTRPGVFVRLWKWLFGDKGPSHETEQVRRLCELFTPVAYQNVIDQMNGGELVALYSTYMGAQAAWAARMREEAERTAEGEMATPTGDGWRGGEVGKAHGSASRVPDNWNPNTNTVRWPATPLRGGAVPAVLHGLGANEVNGRPDVSREVGSREEKTHA